MTETEFLQDKLVWLRDVIVSFEGSTLPVSWKDDSIKRTQQQIRDIEWRLCFKPPRPAPLCAWKGPYASHPWPCPKHDPRCNAQMGIIVRRDLKRLQTTIDHEDE